MQKVGLHLIHTVGGRQVVDKSLVVVVLKCLTGDLTHLIGRCKQVACVPSRLIGPSHWISDLRYEPLCQLIQNIQLNRDLNR